MSLVDGKLLIPDGVLFWRNFSGRETKYNEFGDRNFCVIIDPDTAKELKDLGWNARVLPPRGPDEPAKHYIQVKVNYKKGRPPEITLITRKGKSHLDVETVSLLDTAEIESCKIVIRPYNWDVGGKTGVKAYLQSLYVKVIEDPYAEEFDELPDLGKR